MNSDVSLLILRGLGAECPQNVPPWHADYLELKTVNAQQTQEVFFCCCFYLPKDVHIEKHASGRES